MNKTVTIVVIVIIIIVGALLFWGQRSAEAPVVTPGTEVENVVDSTTPSVNQSTVKEFAVDGTPFKFSLNEIKVKKGDTVRIVFTNVQGSHDWVIDEFNARTKILPAGQTETIEFVADKTGTFEYYCSVGTHRQMGMKGNLIVE